MPHDVGQGRLEKAIADASIENLLSSAEYRVKKALERWKDPADLAIAIADVGYARLYLNEVMRRVGP